MIRDEVALNIYKSLELKRTKSKIFPEVLMILLNWKKLWEEKESMIILNAWVRLTDVERPNSLKVHETHGKL